MAPQHIAFDPDPVDEHLIDGDGEPVWPVRSAEDRAALAAMAALFGAELIERRGRPGDADAGIDDEVVALGERHEAAGRLHAHLTRRRFRGVRSARTLAAESPPAVVVTRLEQLVPELVEALHRRGRGAGPGFVVAGRAPLRRQVLRLAAAARLRTAPAIPRADLHPFSAPVERDHPVAGRGDGPERVRAVLGAGAGVLTVLTHSDGVDASFGDLVLCPMANPIGSADPARSPSCWSSQVCHRLARPLGDAFASGRLVRADQIRCRILVWNACFTLAYRDDPLDPRWSLLARLLDAPGIGAIAAAPDLSHDSTDSLEPLAAALDRGVSLGAALAEHNRHPVRRAIGARLLLFGDPGVALAARAPDRAAARAVVTGSPSRLPTLYGPVAGATPGKRASRACPATGSWPMLETLIAAEEHSPAFFAIPASAARAALDAGAPDQEIRESFADLLACRVRAFTQWTPLSQPAELRGRTAPCPRCGALSRQIGHTMRVAAALPRRVTVCPRCQVVEDVPLGCDLTVALEGDEIAIGGSLPRTDWAARARVYAQVPWNGPLLRWPAGPDGSPVRRLRIGPVATIGVHQATFALVSGREFAAVTARAPLRAGPAALEKAS